ncbi:MAG: S-layer homology domain-containing protein [Oscillospiraceae bacterium]|nr:S-layer homology domain-containing protein [Oscillospiraceae bacterium]
MKRRILSLLLALALMLALLPAAVLTTGAADPAEDWANEIAVFDQIEAELVAAMRERKSSIDLSSYHIHHDEIQLERLNDYSPYISGGISVDCLWNSIGVDKGYYSKIMINYPQTMSASEINAYFDKVEAKIAEVDAMLAAVPDDVDKVLTLHDFFIYNSEYDFTENLSPIADSFNTAGVLLNGRAVCQGYTYAFMYFMNRAGIECHCVVSPPMNHSWNVVRIDSAYYHVDLTWDDPTPDAPGMVGHKFVLLSDAAVSAKRSIGGDKPHYGWDPLPLACSSTQYDYAYWYGADSRIVMIGRDRYYIKDDSIVKNEMTKGREIPLISLGDWPVWGIENAFWIGSFSGLFLYDGKLYYNTATELRRLDIETLEDETAYVPDTSEGYIYGSAVIDGKMIYEIKQSPNERGVRHSVPLEKLTGEHVHSYTAVVTAPTCTDQGYTTHVCECGDRYVDSYVNALGHAWDAGSVTKEPTEAEKGEKTFTCTRCGAVRTEELPQLPHTHRYTDTVTAPTCTEQGYTTHACECGDRYVDSYVNALGHNYVNSVCTRCGAKQAAPVSFSDVKTGDWFYEAVHYAVANGLMNGVGSGRFAPNDPMTRAMLVTVLWRYEGKPQEGKNNFADVPSGQWYTQAVAWAAYNGIVGGVGNGRFDPNGNITREQMAAILFRYADKKGFDTSRRGNLNAFSDQNKVSAYAVDAIGWAVGEGIIGGSDGKLLPGGNATRAQVSTILMRFIENFVKTQSK